MPPHHRINYIELPATDLAASKAFYAAVFGWTYTDYGPEYCSFNEAPNPDAPSDTGLDGGLTTMGPPPTPGASAPLVVFYSGDLEATCEAVAAAGGMVVKPIFDFPGGRRFHFTDPAGNELAVWGESAE
ncbi:MAG: putative enzyme related to lactoylglutathione lyase [Phycisphaerales bacterium]|jgi:predicted enzyme related to lactoylglutathione lyase